MHVSTIPVRASHAPVGRTRAGTRGCPGATRLHRRDSDTHDHQRRHGGGNSSAGVSRSHRRSNHGSQHTHRCSRRHGSGRTHRDGDQRLWWRRQRRDGATNDRERNAATFGLANEGNLGKILVDSQGRSLYLFQKDAGTKSACTGACAAAWPPLRATGKPMVGTALSASKVGTTARSDGKPQITYNGHPLYLYSADQKPGDTNGQGLNLYGGGWFALSAAGNMVSGTGTNGGASGY